MACSRCGYADTIYEGGPTCCCGPEPQPKPPTYDEGVKMYNRVKELEKENEELLTKVNRLEAQRDVLAQVVKDGSYTQKALAELSTERESNEAEAL